MSLTYKQIINKFEQIASNNPFINRYGSGEITEIEVSGPTSGDYPILWIVPQQVEVGENDLVYVVRVLVFDIDDTDDSKQEEILSDTLRTLIDVIRTFRNEDSDYQSSDRPICLPFTHRFVDYNTGWYTDLRLITDMNNNPCSDY